MYKQIGASFLVAGTCIGSGMIALPLILAKLGLVLSLFLMLSVWGLMYYTSLITLELVLQARQELSLGELGAHFSGIKAKLVGIFSLKILSYALLSVYLYGGASIIQKLISSLLGTPDYNLKILITGFAVFTTALLLLPFTFLDYINRFLFIGLIVVGSFLIVGLTTSTQWSNVPLLPQIKHSFSLWSAVIPVVFTSFGYQVIFHTLASYCNYNARMLKKIFFWGSLIPAVVYIIWTSSVISVVYQERPLFYAQMIHGTVEVGDLIKELSFIAQGYATQLLIWWISLLAIITSLVGVGVGLCSSLQSLLPKQTSKIVSKIISVLMAIFPPYIISTLVPNAFVSILGFAGGILSIIAILLPVYLFVTMKEKRFLHYPILRHKSGLIGSVIIGLIVILCEFYALF